jgi:hypothetical protein
MATLGVNDFGIDENEFGARIFLESNVDDRNAAANADLRRGQADSVRGVHGLEHVGDELLQLFVKARDLFRWFLENGIAEFYDGINHQ